MLVSHNVQKKLPTLVINRLWTYDVRQLQLCSPANARHHLYNLSAADMTCTECEPFGCPQSPEKKTAANQEQKQTASKMNGAIARSRIQKQLLFLWLSWNVLNHANHRRMNLS